MDATGHSTEQMFLKYINPVNPANVVSLSNYFDAMYEKIHHSTYDEKSSA